MKALKKPLIAQARHAHGRNTAIVLVGRCNVSGIVLQARAKQKRIPVLGLYSKRCPNMLKSRRRLPYLLEGKCLVIEALKVVGRDRQTTIIGR